MGKLHVGIFGPSLSGKTTLAKSLSRSYWNKGKVKSLVLDLNLEDWGPQAYVTNDQEKWEWFCWKGETGCAVFCDEGTETLARDDTMTKFFTRIRHRGHKFHIMGHYGTVCTPTMRGQISTLYLFRQTEMSARIWSDQFTDERIMKATTLKEYEFIHAELYGDVSKKKLAI